MRNLTLPQKREAVAALEEPVSADLSEVGMLKAKLSYLRSVLRGMLIRTPLERRDDVQKVLRELDSLPSSLQVQAMVDAYYNPTYFRNEPDVQFKIELACALQSYMRLRVPSYSNQTLKLVAEQSLDANGLLRNFIEE